jgi:DNA-directed RNA polymerase specialized sigma24 family protein
MTPQTPSLVSEAYLQLAGSARLADTADAQFLALASVCMGRLLIDKARRRYACQRLQADPVDIADIELGVRSVIERTFPVHEALRQLAVRNPRRAIVVRLRFLQDLSLPEITRRTGLSLATVERELKAGLEGLKELLQD